VKSLAAFLKNCLRRVEDLSPELHMALHTGPNRDARGWPQDWWGSIEDDFHWHIEINPDIEGQRRVFGGEGFYFNPIPAEDATLVLRALGPGAGAPAT
jgi:UDPglucose--hexose-1-phosphate uridylyltransferase